MAVFMYDFTAYEPQHRCLVSGCDDATNAGETYPDFLNFTTPWDEDIEQFSKCNTFERISVSNATLSCDR